MISVVSVTQVVTEPTDHDNNNSILIDIIYVSNDVGIICCHNVDLHYNMDHMLERYEMDIFINAKHV